jgi:hypothetical protein
MAEEEAAAPAPSPMKLEDILKDLEVDTEEVVVNQMPLLFTDEGTKALSKFTQAVLVAFNNCDLTSLEKFPSMPELEVLELSDNPIEGGLEALQNSKKLKYLSLGGCPLTLKALEPLKKLELIELDVEGSPAESEEGFRDKMFAAIPTLTVLNGADKDGKEIEDDDVVEDWGEEELEGDEDEDDDDDDEEDEEEDEEEDDEEGEQKLEKVDLAEWYKTDAQDDDNDEDYKGKAGDVGTREPSKRKREAPAEEEPTAAKKGKVED